MPKPRPKPKAAGSGYARRRNSKRPVPKRRQTVKTYMQQTANVEDNYEALKMNPLKLPDLLTKVLDLLPVKDLKACRLVCRDWSIPALKGIQKSEAVVTLSSGKNVRKFYSLQKRKKASGVHFFNKFRLDHSFCQHFQTKFAQFGSHIKVLHLKYSTQLRFLSVVNLSNIHTILNTTPNLETLTIFNPFELNQRADEETDPGAIVPLTKLKSITITIEISVFQQARSLQFDLFVSYGKGYMDLIQAAPSLETLNIHSPFVVWTAITPHTFLDILKNIKTLKNLSLSEDVLNRDEMRSLASNEFFNLKTLSVCDHVRSPASFIPILNRHSGTLKELTFTICPSLESEIAFRMSFMENLVHLTIASRAIIADVYDPCLIEIKNTTRSQFPKLKKLTLSNLGAETLQQIFLNFNFVEQLEIITQTGFEKGFQFYPEGDVNDALSGIPCPGWVLTSFQDHDIKSEVEPIRSYSRMITGAAQPNLCNFTNLQQLEIFSEGRSGVVQDSLALLTLMRLPPLDLLIIKGYILSEGAVNKLKKYHKIVCFG